MAGLRIAASRFAALEPAVVALAAPSLLFPTVVPTGTVIALVAILAVWLARWAGAGRPGARSPFDVALLLFSLAVVAGIWASAYPALTVPKLAGLVLGLAAFRAVVNATDLDTVHAPRRLWVASLVFLALGLGLLLAGVVGADWQIKWPTLSPILTRLPRLVGGLPGAEEGIHLNELAGALLLFLPVSLALLWSPNLGRGWEAAGLRLAALLVTMVIGTVVFLTQSRSAWIGAVAAAGVMVWLRWPRIRWLLAAGLLIFALVLLYIGPQAVLESVFASEDPVADYRMTDPAQLGDRLELYEFGLSTLGDFALTGCGLGTFRQMVAETLPELRGVFGPDVGHAHNVFLQIGLDLGVPGLISYLALIGTALWIGGRVAQLPQSLSPEGEFRWLGLGIVGSLVAFHIYGITDTVALGAKPGVAFWLLLGLAAALWRMTRKPPAEQHRL